MTDHHFNPPPVRPLPAPQLGPRLVRLDDDTWVDPTRVESVSEEYYPGSNTWVVLVHLRGRPNNLSLSETRAATVAALINGEDLR